MSEMEWAPFKSLLWKDFIAKLTIYFTSGVLCETDLVIKIY